MEDSRTLSLSRWPMAHASVVSIMISRSAAVVGDRVQYAVSKVKLLCLLAVEKMRAFELDWKERTGEHLRKGATRIAEGIAVSDWLIW